MNMDKKIIIYVDVSLLFLVTVLGEMVPCGDITINDENSICCEDRVYIRHGVQPACCGMMAYDAFSHLCCLEYVWPKMGDYPMCCGNQMYDAAWYECSADGHLTMKIDPRRGGHVKHPTMSPNKKIEPDKGDYFDPSIGGSGINPTESPVTFRSIVYKTRSPTKGSDLELTTVKKSSIFPVSTYKKSSDIIGRNIKEMLPKKDTTGVVSTDTPFTVKPTTPESKKMISIVYKTRTTDGVATDFPIHDLSDLPEVFWPIVDSKENREDENKDVEDTSKDLNPDNYNILVPILSKPVEKSTTKKPWSTTQKTTLIPPMSTSVHVKPYGTNAVTRTPKFVTIPDESGTRPSYPPLLPKGHESKTTETDPNKCCSLLGFDLYKCCLSSLNNSVSSVLPLCCSGFVVKVCCWTGDNTYSCCSRQEACCHPEKLFHNLQRNHLNDREIFKNNFQRLASSSYRSRSEQPYIAPTESTRRGTRRCCQARQRPSCCVTFTRRRKCCRVSDQRMTPPAIHAPWRPRVVPSTEKPTTVTTTQSTSHALNTRNCCLSSNDRPTCCSTLFIRPYCCFRKHRSQKTDTNLVTSRPSTVIKRGCSCRGRSCCESRNWPKRCCRVRGNQTNSFSNGLLHVPQNTEQETDDSRPSCCKSKDPSTCCWILYVQTSLTPSCCEQHLKFGANNKPQPMCSGKSYNPVKEMCCQGNKEPKNGVRPRCCGRRGYDAYLYYCCRGRISRTCL